MQENIFTEYLPYAFLLFGAALAAIAVFWESAESKLKQTGIPVQGIVFKQEVDNNNRSSSSTYPPVKDKITVQFNTLNGDTIRGVMKQDFQIHYTGQYKDGEAIDIYYDPNDPHQFYVDSRQSERMARIAGVVGGCIFITIGAVKLYMYYNP